MMFYDDPRIMYENPPPPPGYEFDFKADPIFFTYPRPQRISNVTYITIDRSLIHEDLLGDEEEEGEQNSTEAINENIETVETGELNAEASVDVALEVKIDKNKASKKKVVENDDLKKTRMPCQISQKDESVVVPSEKKERKQKDRSKEKKTRTDSDNSKISKKKKAQYIKTSALESILESYSRKSISESDSDSEKKKKSKSSSHRKKSHSSKSGHRRKDKDSRNNISRTDAIPYDREGFRSTEFSVKQEIISSDEESVNPSLSKRAEITIKEEVFSDKEDREREKRKSSKSRRKKYRNGSRDRFDDDRDRDRYRDDSRKNYRDYSSSDDSRKRYSDDDVRSRYGEDSWDRYYEDSNSRGSNPYIKREIEQESGSTTAYGLNDYYCDVCKLNLNSETTFSSHMAGKRHKKAVRQLSEKEVAKSSIMEITDSQNFPRPHDVDRIQLYDEESRIQEVCDDAKILIVGLDYVQEIRGYEETKYYCDLCDAQCVANSIMRHLVGNNHQMNCLKKYHPRTYDRIKDNKDRRSDRELKHRLEDAEAEFGRGRIKVFKDIKKSKRCPEPYDPYQPSTSRQNLDLPNRRADELIITDEHCLSRDFSDFYCKVCDSHMNNYSMWESHARGKKHAKNKKKPYEVSDSNFIEAPRGTISHLEMLITEQCEPDDIIVGLNFIKENQGENGDLYNCFLCGSVCPTMDIIDHLYLIKHKGRYLEKMYANGHDNGIESINSLPLHEDGKAVLIDDECRVLLRKVGRGKPVIAVAKTIY